MNRYETNSKGTSPALSALNNTQTQQPRSAFDLSRRKSFDAAPFAIIPIEVFPMLPNSDLYLTYDVQAISKNPTIRRILSSMSVELRTYYVRNSDCWEGWNDFITKGRSGTLNLSIPTLEYKHTGGDDIERFTSFPYNPYQYLNIAPPTHFDLSQSFVLNQGILRRSRSVDGTEYVSKTGLLSESFRYEDSTSYRKQSALPAVFYNKIAKQYQNANLLQNNKDWYPENENHDNILSYNATSVRTSSYDNPNAQFMSSVDGVLQDSIQPTNDAHSKPWLNVLYYRQRKGNPFNTGSPFPDLIRGDTPTLQILNGSIDWSNVLAPDSGRVNVRPWILALDGNAKEIGVLGTTNRDYPIPNLGANLDNSLGWTSVDSSGSTLPGIAGNSGGNVRGFEELQTALSKASISGINFSMSQWRKLATLTVFRERMARTDGSYNQMIQAQFNYNPRWHEHDVVYCGGSYQPIVFSEVVQTSEDSGTPLGTTAGRAVTANTGNSISVHSNDYGMVMTVMTIVPDDYYSQGINRIWSNLDQATQYFPIMNNLEPTAIKNKELFISGNDSVDEDVFTYQELFFEYKSRLNEISGLMALPISKVGETGAYIFNRLFNSTPAFNNVFVTGKMTDNENLVFASTEQAQFIFSVASMAKFVAPLPAVTQPSDMGISY